MWVPTNRRISGNETVDKAAKSGSAHSFTWQEPTCGISDTSARWAIRGWINGAHLEYWEPTFRHKCVQCFLEEPPLPQIWGLLQLNKFYLRQMMELFTRHCHMWSHLFKMGKWYRGPFVKSALKQQHTTAIFWLQQGFITYYIISWRQVTIRRPNSKDTALQDC